MLKKKGKIFVLCGMIALLVVTGTLNIVLNLNNGEHTETSTVVENADFFTAYRTDREQMRKEQMLSLDAIISSETSSEVAVEGAELEKVALTTAMGTELELETLIKAVGFEDAVVIASSENVSVILKTGPLADEQVARVLQIVTDETGKMASSVRIIPIE